MLLLITDSHDVTSDCIVKKWDLLGYNDYFRFNTDLYEFYSIELTSEGFVIKDPQERQISHDTITALYWRKPWMTIQPERYSQEDFENTQRKYFIRELANLCIQKYHVYHLVEPNAEHRVGKIIQMTTGSRYFTIPEWKIVSGNKVKTEQPPWLIKTLYSMRVGHQSPIVSSWDKDTLSPQYQWFLQKEAKGEFDVTVVYVNGTLFAYRLRRDHLDWRFDINESMSWEKFTLDNKIQNNIQAYMTELGLRYGRLDFIQDKAGNLYFLEVNPNGQFAWLDLEDSDGLISCVAQNAISHAYT